MVPPLSIELFFRAGEDREGAQYRILAALRAHQYALQQRRLLPTWREAQALRELLHSLLQQSHLIERALPHTVVGINWEELRLETLPEYTPAARERFLQHLLQLAEWALPQVEELCEESQALYDFALEHITVHEVGIISLHRDEGFLLIPHRTQHELLVWRYHALPVFGADQRRLVHLRYLTSIPIGGIWAPHLWHHSAQAALPNPPRGTTYICEADTDFPLHATLLPIAEQKLAERLAAA